MDSLLEFEDELVVELLVPVFVDEEVPVLVELLVPLDTLEDIDSLVPEDWDVDVFSLTPELVPLLEFVLVESDSVCEVRSYSKAK